MLVDAGLIGALLAIGTLARAVFTPLQTLIIPASVIAGILGLALGPNGAGWLPFSDQVGTYGSIVIVFVFVCLALTDDFDVRKIGRPVGSFAAYGVLIYASQVAIGALAALLILHPLFHTPDSFGLLLFAGWAGGFGSAAAVGAARGQRPRVCRPDLHPRGPAHGRARPGRRVPRDRPPHLLRRLRGVPGLPGGHRRHVRRRRLRPG
ncbi:hypothetical protein KW076_06620 [Micrococcus porci]|uniref:hypothetical protein n=1 Tax=Micrococcus porci TaxID=2856555 RepID=UPI001CCAB04D|nr:hypothetical protein [Micrococcus porci]UBH23583.1 hypothetical protein KW076_06620 [Micrococcus porci]